MDRGSAVEDAGTPARRRRGEKWWFLWSIRRLAPVAVLLHRLKEVDAADAARCCWAPRRTRALPAERVIIAMKDWLETKRGGGEGGFGGCFVAQTARVVQRQGEPPGAGKKQ